MGCKSSKSTVSPASKTPVLVEPPAEEVKKVEQEVKTAQVAAIIAEIPQEAKDIWKNSRAQKKFKALDADGSGKLEANELNALAEWVWGSFNPKQTINDAIRREWATKIKDACDKNDDGVIDKEEFEVYYVNVCKEMNDHHKDRIAKERAAKKAAADNAL
jgi:Ca2+-binding EF-hand superfamily protein